MTAEKINNNKLTREKKKKTFSGTVVSDKMKDTVVVAVVRFSKHPKYGKFLKLTKRYKAHDKDNKHKVGDKVQIEETRPLSKSKSFRVIEN
jgi:small subunit ribosomal protein S17